MTVIDLLARARSASGKKIKYKLGAGGIQPATASPANVNQECDCSGYVCWCLGMSRQTTHPLYVKFNGGWINTDAMVKDAGTQTGFFHQLDGPQPGCLVVYPSKLPTRKVGHVGIVTEVAEGKAARVIHCSLRNFRTKGDAILETTAAAFGVPDAIYAWYEGLG